jgi:hypothetical protein
MLSMRHENVCNFPGGGLLIEGSNNRFIDIM